MGLDVYLNRYSDHAKAKANEEAYDKYSTQLWDFVESLTGDAKDKATEDVREKLKVKAAELGLNDWGSDVTYCEKIEKDSVLHPDHYFKIGYFRSSYNGSGINRVLEDLGIPTLYDIFEPNDEYEFQPNWSKALGVVEKCIKLMKKDKGYRVETVSANMFAPDDVPTSPAAAMEIFKDEQKKNSKNKNFLCYSNKNGEFYLDNDGMKVHGLIPGKDFMSRPCTFIIYQNQEASKFYLQALEIVKETIQFVLAQEDPQNYYLSWSS